MGVGGDLGGGVGLLDVGMVHTHHTHTHTHTHTCTHTHTHTHMEMNAFEEAWYIGTLCV
jgi:hypothetical protein